MPVNVPPADNCWRRCVGEGAVGWYRGYLSPDTLNAMIVKGKARRLNDPPPASEQFVPADAVTSPPTPETDAAASDPEPEAAPPTPEQPTARRPRSVR